ncbi:winged helix-turn-helix transcriptional regulator [Burkholderia cepacia]|uniref:winged helix-turn-helix transcriptional regulator n=1 Tax=Burkholderia cepacia TaxID=292 RepID=UPI000AE963D4|nr:winged helix-turn-helix transcriptional regulator [Burkholderia cepacia]
MRPDERRLDDDLSDGIGTRTVFAEVPPRVEYALTEFGRTLVSVLNAMTQWDDAYLA